MKKIHANKHQMQFFSYFYRLSLWLNSIGYNKNSSWQVKKQAESCPGLSDTHTTNEWTGTSQKKLGCLEIQDIKYVKIASDSGPKKGKITENKYHSLNKSLKSNHQNIKKFQLKTTHKWTYENYE